MVMRVAGGTLAFGAAFHLFSRCSAAAKITISF
jgi:hypothetical protein